jgi:hypothetical protein
VVAANQRDPVWVSYFEAEKEEERFERVETAVYEVACVIISFLAARGGVTAIPIKR